MFKQSWYSLAIFVLSVKTIFHIQNNPTRISSPLSIKTFKNYPPISNLSSTLEYHLGSLMITFSLVCPQSYHPTQYVLLNMFLSGNSHSRVLVGSGVCLVATLQKKKKTLIFSSCRTRFLQDMVQEEKLKEWGPCHLEMKLLRHNQIIVF